LRTTKEKLVDHLEKSIVALKSEVCKGKYPVSTEAEASKTEAAQFVNS